MKKQEFLEELKQYLYVLEDEEQDDILQEYEQHIEIKIEKGLDEEEAIRDFGSVRELAKEILEAYHVKPNTGADAGEKIPKDVSKKRLIKSLPLAVHTVKIQGKKAGKKVFKGFVNLWIFIRKSIKKPFRILGKAFDSGKEKIQNHQGNGKRIGILCRSDKEVLKEGGRVCEGNKESRTEKIKKEPTEKRTGVFMIAKGIRSICDGIIHMICWAGRLVWNCGVVCAAAFSAFMGLVFLYLFGMLFVLWKQGYPLGGIVLGCMGAVLCFLSLAVFGSTFYRNKKQILLHKTETVEEIKDKKSIKAAQNMEIKAE